jgi:hypothetical protein
LKKCRKKEKEKEKKVEKGRRERKGELNLSFDLIDYPRYFSARKKAQEKEQAAIKESIHNSNLWEARLNLLELGRKHYRFDYSQSFSFHYFIFIITEISLVH